MADALISALVKDLLGRLTSAAIQEYRLQRRLENDLLTLGEEYNQIQAVLKDAEEKKTREEAVELWLKSLRSESLKMENLLDDVSTEAMLRQLHKELGKKHRLRAFFSSDHNPLMFRTTIAHKVKAIRRRFADISAKRLDLNLSPGNITSPVDGGIGGGIPSRETSSLIHSSTVFGRNEELKMVIEKICNTDIGKKEAPDIPVYAIWGMGGLGKTTLAQLVYNDERVKEHFDPKCWIYVSENFQVKKLLKGISESDSEDSELSLDALQKRVQDKLRGKRFLVVLDDVWIENNETDRWEDLSKTLSCGAEGSIVVMTTRSKTTSRMMAKFPELQHELGCLSQEDSWLLFKKFAFAEGREGGDITELEPIGKTIVEKCKGLPLAVKTLGGLMWSKSSTSDWQRVMRSDIWELQEKELQEINILPALKLSYDNLHPHVKRCFAYCCMLPKGHYMGKDLLILLWKANRLIPPGGEDWHVFGVDIFNYLVWRSFLQDVSGYIFDNGYFQVNNEYIMHDLMHDLARYVMGHDCLIMEPGKELIVPDEVLHLSSSCPDFASLQPHLEKLKSLRSVFIFHFQVCGVSDIFDHVYLRVLYLKGIELQTLPESICKLKHLRYLNLSYSDIEVLPESIIYLQNLQVLLLNVCRKLYKLPEGMGYMRNLQYLNLSNSCIRVLPESIIYLQNLQMLLLNDCEFLCKLPEGMGYMRNLQYLDLESCDSLGCLPVGIGKLTGLQIRLPRFRIRKNEGAQIRELGYLNLFGPYLELTGLENVKGLIETRSANLKSKTNLFDLKLTWSPVSNEEEYDAWTPYSDAGPIRGHDEEVLEGLEPNPILKKLRIFGYMGKNISPSWMVNLRSLVEIKFTLCYHCEHIPPLGKLPSLRVIKLRRLESLKCFHDGDMSGDHILFPHLRELEIYDCRELINLPSNFPKLEELTLVDCPKLVSLPEEIQSFKDLNTLEILRCENLSRRYAKDVGVDWPKISHIPNIKRFTPRSDSEDE